MKRSSSVYHLLLAAIVLASLIIQVTQTLTVPTDMGPGQVTQAEPVGVRLVHTFSYFTIQSNILLLLAAGTLALSAGRDGRLWRVLRLDALLGIIITGLVYATILAGSAHPHGWGWWSNLGFHYVAPWVALLGWLLFGPRPRIDGRTVAWAFVWPALWIGYTLAHGAVTGWYPYAFCDVSALGYPAALRNLAIVVVLAVLFAGILRLLDTRLPRFDAASAFVPAQRDSTHDALKNQDA